MVRTRSKRAVLANLYRRTFERRVDDTAQSVECTDVYHNDGEVAPRTTPKYSSRNSVRARLRWFSNQRLRQHCKEDGAERNVVGELP
jgi:hypothetical protein